MTIGIICAMEKESKDFLIAMGEYETIKIHHVTFYKGKIKNNEIIFAVSGIGKVQSSMIATLLFDNFTIDKLINLGVSGGNSRYVKRGEVVIGESYSYADANAEAFGHPFGSIPYCPKYYEGDKELISKVNEDCIIGTILTGDKFFIDGEEVKYLEEKHFNDVKVVALDMESTALAQVAYTFNVPFIAIRAISDLVGGSSEEEIHDAYFDYVYIACKKACDILYDFLNNL